MSRRKQKRRRSGAAGLAILVLAGVGIWIVADRFDEAGAFLPRTLDRAAEEAAAPPPIPAPWDRIRVEVLNAGGVRGMAASARDELRDAGFDVVHYGNASSFDADRSEVILRGGGREAADGVARALGIEVVRVEPDSTLLVEVTVRLGSDWRTREVRAADAEAGATGRREPGAEGGAT